jgi:hypothetical protein
MCAKMAYEESPERRAVASDKLESTWQNRLNLTETEMEAQEIKFNRGIQREEKNICRITNRGEKAYKVYKQTGRTGPVYPPFGCSNPTSSHIGFLQISIINSSRTFRTSGVARS